MPQTLSDWWKHNLGGNEEAERIRLELTNTVGNFAIVSQGYNSSMSNGPWSEKREELKKVQFRVAAEAADVEQWGETAIRTRGRDLAIRASKAITSPRIRTRDYRTRSSNETNTGLYPLLDGDDSLSGAILRAIVYNGERKECSTWSRLLSVVGDFLYSSDPVLFAESVADVVWYSKDKSDLRKPIQVPDSPWFCCGGGYNGIHFRNIAARIAVKMGCLEHIQLEVVNPTSGD
jgi:hypothetical protein